VRGAVVALGIVAAGCGDNRVEARPDDALARDAPVDIGDGPPGLPDITFSATEMTRSVLLDTAIFQPNDCSIAEQCIAAAGVRRMLRFDTVTPNIGMGDLVLGAPPPPGESNAVFVWSPCHGHHHVANYADYQLLDGDQVVVAGHKQGFCLEDTEREIPGSGSRGYSCSYQGISTGWADKYSRYLPCQWIDVTDVPAGTYTLRIRVNPLQMFPESDYTNNELTMEVSI